jgi:hypothetical protein
MDEGVSWGWEVGHIDGASITGGAYGEEDVENMDCEAWPAHGAWVGDAGCGSAISRSGMSKSTC